MRGIISSACDCRGLVIRFCALSCNKVTVCAVRGGESRVSVSIVPRRPSGTTWLRVFFFSGWRIASCHAGKPKRTYNSRGLYRSLACFGLLWLALACEVPRHVPRQVSLHKQDHPKPVQVWSAECQERRATGAVFRTAPSDMLVRAAWAVSAL